MTIYLDNAATSFPKPECVYEALDAFARRSLANPGRSGHRMALGAERAIADGRHELNQFFHGKGAERWVFTLNCTDALNIAIKGLLVAGDHVITTDLEHNSVSRPLRALELAGRISVTRLAADAGGTVDPDAVRAAIGPKTRLVAMTHASNVVGTVQPVGEVGRIARERDVLLLVDAAQTAGVIAIDVQAMHIDLLALPGHKSLMGPTGTGALYVAPGVEVAAWREGGTGGNSLSETQPRDFPHFLEGGTPNVLGIAGLTAGVRWVRGRGLEAIHAHEVALVERLWRRLDETGGYRVLGHRDHARRVGTISFLHEGLSAPDMGGILDVEFDVAIRSGLHCAPFVHHAHGTVPDGAVRVSPGPFNTAEDIDALAAALAEMAL